jgi:hypothetical protein
MLFYKKIMIIIIIILFSYLLIRLNNKRKQIINENQNHSLSLESFMSGIQLSDTFPQTLKLSDYCIKSSLNSAYNVTSRNIDCDPENGGGILKIILQRGVRFLDFEVFSVDEKPIVGYSSSYDPTNTINEASNHPKKDNFIHLNNIFKFILSNKPINITDPLFIQLRIKTQKTELYSIIANYIHDNFDGALYQKGKITENTLLSDIKNKIIIVVDTIHSNASYSNLDNEHPFKKLVNLETGTSLTTIQTNTLIQSSQKRININTDGVTITSNEKPPQWVLTYPDLIATSNPDIKTLMTKQCPNIIQCRFDYDDANLALYENIFKNMAFVPLGNAYKTASKF